MNLPRCWRLRQARRLRRLRDETRDFDHLLRRVVASMTREERQRAARACLGDREVPCYPTCGRVPWKPDGLLSLCTHRIHGPWL